MKLYKTCLKDNIPTKYYLGYNIDNYVVHAINKETEKYNILDFDIDGYNIMKLNNIEYKILDFDIYGYNIIKLNNIGNKTLTACIKNNHSKVIISDIITHTNTNWTQKFCIAHRISIQDPEVDGFHQMYFLNYDDKNDVYEVKLKNKYNIINNFKSNFIKEE